jgi:hypothetical protein
MMPVNGAFTTAEKKPNIPRIMKLCQKGERLGIKYVNTSKKLIPMVAPMESIGKNIPPGVSEVYEISVNENFRKSKAKSKERVKICGI